MKTATAIYKPLVQKLLGWDDLQYAEFQYEMGLLYLHQTLLGGDDTWLNELSASKIYWQWWVNQWNIRDSQFLRDVANVTGYHHNLMVDKYQGMNQPGDLMCKPHKCVLEETYAVMMQHFIDETVKP